MIKYCHKAIFIWVAAICLWSCPCTAKDPITSYFSKLLDESRAEIAIGNLLFSGFVDETKNMAQIATSAELDAIVNNLAQKSPRTNIPYRVYILESKIPGEMPFPGGPVIITSGMLSLAQGTAEKTFLIARNIMHVALRQPMMAIKKEALYARILKFLKQPSAKRDSQQVRMVLRDYLKATIGMDQIKADREGLSLSDNPIEIRNAGVAFLKRLSETLWPVMPGEWFDIPTRIKALESATF